MVKLSDLLVDKSLHGLGMDQCDVILFITSSITLDGVTSFSQLLDVQNVRENTRFSLNKSCGKFWQSFQDSGIVIDYEGFVHIFNLFEG